MENSHVASLSAYDQIERDGHPNFLMDIPTSGAFWIVSKEHVRVGCRVGLVTYVAMVVN